MPTNFPISLQASPVPNNLSVATLTEFMQLVAQYISGSVSADVTFFLEGSVDPTVDEGVVFFNTSQNCFKSWNNDTGSYLPIGFLFTDTLPLTNQGYIYLTSTNTFYYWNGASYSPVTNAVNGDILVNYLNADELSRGYVLAAGSRTIDSITALTTAQNAALHTLFGAGAGVQIPNITSLTSTVGGGGGSGGTTYAKIYVGVV